MAIEIHGFNYLRWLATRREFEGRVITIGRQALDVDATFAMKVIGKNFAASRYCEEALIALGAESVESIDSSGYEGATYVADLNRPYLHPYRYDMVCDFGTLEHIFDIGTAFRNVIGLCRLHGRIVHLLPVNNLNGHGFWQFCSDLLYEIYSEKNGFSETEVFYASGLDSRYWFKAPLPCPGVRIEVCSLEPIVLLCKTTKCRDLADLDVQQRFYSHAWAADTRGAAPAARESGWEKLRGFGRRALRSSPSLYVAARNCWIAVGLIFGASHYSVGGRQFKRLRVSELMTET